MPVASLTFIQIIGWINQRAEQRSNVLIAELDRKLGEA